MSNNNATDSAPGMNAQQLQDYMGLLVEQHETLGEHYVSAQLAWAESQLVALGVQV